jgi:hypothetical protein
MTAGLPSLSITRRFRVTASMAFVNPLAAPKGAARPCELCSAPATVQCTKCHVTFYWCVTRISHGPDCSSHAARRSSRDHCDLDWRGIHEKVCAMLVPLRTQSPFVGSEAARARRAEVLTDSRKALAEMSQTEAAKHLVAGHHDLAVSCFAVALACSNASILALTRSRYQRRCKPCTIWVSFMEKAASSWCPLCCC